MVLCTENCVCPEPTVCISSQLRTKTVVSEPCRFSGEWIHLVDFPSFLTRETTFVTSYLPSWTSSLFWKRICSKMQEFAPEESKFFPSRVDISSERQKKKKKKKKKTQQTNKKKQQKKKTTTKKTNNQYDRVASPECVSIRLKVSVHDLTRVHMRRGKLCFRSLHKNKILDFLWYN